MLKTEFFYDKAKANDGQCSRAENPRKYATVQFYVMLCVWNVVTKRFRSDGQHVHHHMHHYLQMHTPHLRISIEPSVMVSCFGLSLKPGPF